ncbi:ABC transporter ATP-binding protein [Aliikangiella marina]|uniref:ABC transporter ATP-binding protein n=2 Tax=Aliikangiella marina TaxID=1712262 RepID=A0A545TEH5_9GAMM|nr:ABC transporter ATP-binding protein [Aliikangiella marina]
MTVESLSWRVQDKSILNNVSFSVCPTEFVGIIGPNGAGKSSLLRCLYGVNVPTEGEVRIADKNILEYSRQALAQKIAVVLQEPPSRFELSVNDVIAMGLTPQKSLLSFDNHLDKQKVIEASRQVDLLDKLHQSFNSLSGGEKQRAMIARAIVQDTHVLILDEPTNHLDIRHQLEVLTLAKSLQVTVICSMHDLNLAATFCDRLILLDQGSIIAEGSPESVLTEANLNRVFDIKAKVDTHPFTQKLRITFDLGEHIDAD